MPDYKACPKKAVLRGFRAYSSSHLGQRLWPSLGLDAYSIMNRHMARTNEKSQIRRLSTVHPYEFLDEAPQNSTWVPQSI